jgi:hypothetical protein
LAFVTLAWMALFAGFARAETATLINPTKTAYRRQVARLPVGVPESARTGDYRVGLDGREVPCQLGEADGKNWIWVAASLEPGQRAEYVVEKGRPAEAQRPVSVARQGDVFVLDNGRLAVKVPAVAGDGLPSPVEAVRVGGRWIGSGQWHTQRMLVDFTATVLGDGPLFARVRLRYEFQGEAGLHGNVPAFAEVDVTLWRNRTRWTAATTGNSTARPAGTPVRRSA